MANDLVTGPDLGPEFDLGNIQANTIRIKLGSGLAIQVDGTIVTTTANPPLSKNELTAGQDANANAVATMTNVRQDTGWTGAAYSGTPDSIDITAMSEAQIADNVNRQRPNPCLILEKSSNGGAFVEVAQSRTGYIRDATDHEESSNTIVWTDDAPGLNPEYRLSFRIESNQAGLVPLVRGHLTCRAYT